MLLTDLLWVLGTAQALVIVSVDWVCAGERKQWVRKQRVVPG